MEHLGSHWTEFHEILYLRIFRKSVEKIQVSLKSDKNKGTLHEDQYTFFIISCSFRIRMRNVSDRSCRENQNTHFVVSNFFFPPPENRAVNEITWENIAERGRPKMTIWCMLDTQDYKYAHSGCVGNSHCFSTATMVARTRLNVTLYVHCLSRSYLINTMALHTVLFFVK